MVRLLLENATDTLSLDTFVDGRDGWQAIPGVTGLGLPSVSAQFMEGAGDGALYRGRRVLPRDIDIPLYAEAGGRRELKAVLSKMARMLAHPCRLRFIDDAANESWFVDVVHAGGGDYVYGVDTTGDDDLETIVTLRAGDPFWTSDQVKTLSMTTSEQGDGLLPRLAELPLSPPAVGGNFVVNVEGDAESLPTWVITGPATSFRAVSPSGEVISWSGDLAAGEQRIIDTASATILDGNGVNRYAELGEAPRFWRLPPGEVQVSTEVTGVSAGSLEPIGDPIVNLFQNPSFEAEGSTVEVCRNQIIPIYPDGDTNGWGVARSALGALSNPEPGVVRYTVGSQSASGVQTVTIEGGPAEVDFFYSGRIEVRASGGIVGSSGNAIILSGGQGVAVGAFHYTGEWQVVDIASITVSEYSGGDTYIYVTHDAGDVEPGDWIEFRKPQVQRVQAVGQEVWMPWFVPGQPSPDPDLTAEWLGVAGNSESVLQAVQVPGIYYNPTEAPHPVPVRSSRWAAEGSHSVRPITRDASQSPVTGILPALAPGVTCTVAFYLHNPDSHPLAGDVGLIRSTGGAVLTIPGLTTGAVPTSGLYRHTFTLPEDWAETGSRVRLPCAQGVGDSMWTDMLTVVEGEHPNLMPFSGSTPNSPRNGINTWTGPVNNSPSEKRPAEIQGATNVSLQWRDRKAAVI